MKTCSSTRIVPGRAGFRLRRGYDGRVSRRLGFTLLELLAAIAILALMTTLLFEAFGQASRGWMQAENRVESFSQARAVLDLMSREISQAVVNSNITFLGDSTDIAFVAPVNQGTNAVDLMEVVYRLSVAPASGAPTQGVFTNGASDFPKSLVRRSSRFGAPAIEGWDYGQGSVATSPPWDFYGASPNPNWPETSIVADTAVLAENVMGLSFYYMDTNGAQQVYWNSNVARPPASWQHELLPAIPAGTVGTESSTASLMTNRSPSGIQIVLTVIDSKAAARLKGLAVGSAGYTNIVNQSSRVFTTFVPIPNRQP